MFKKGIVIAVIVSLSIGHLFADEGMWIPLLLKKYNIEDMQKKGFKLTADDIYNVNKACMKDGIVIFGRGCTAELISDKGLILTNHHCGYGQIQKHSSLENDYLTDGFWAMNNDEELSNPGLTVTFLVSMEDVTEKVLKDVTDELDDGERSANISEAIASIKEEAGKENNYKIEVKPFYYGNEYYMFVYETYKDVRLVGAPPSAIGKFGGDTDNWMWPRHTGDFSLFRIYADKDNKPAEYSKDNVPYKPKFHFPISLNGVKKGDFTMVFGYPGSTQQYLTSFAVSQLINTVNPKRIEVRQKKLDIIKADMETSPKVRIQYSSKAAGIANAWKKWIGENRGLKRLDAINKKIALESRFQEWANSDDTRKKEYGEILNEYKNLYADFEKYQIAINYTHEALFSLDIMEVASSLYRLKDTEVEEQAARIEALKRKNKNFFKDYNFDTDKKLYKAMVELYKDNVDVEYHPIEFENIDKKFKGNVELYVNSVYEKSFFADEKKVEAFLDSYSEKSIKTLEKDPIFNLYQSIAELYVQKILYQWRSINSNIEKLNRIYVKGLREMQTDKLFYPDANFTMRIAYGKVDDYFPADGVKYTHFTTLEGIMEKDNPEIYDYDVPDKLRELYKNKDYGRYGVNSTMPVCFTATNHTTGGNSGSPVINGRGEIVGLNFDRNWEGTMSDIMYDPDMCRNISLDVRYALFLIDKLAGAKHLIEEMTLVKTYPPNKDIIRHPIREAKK